MAMTDPIADFLTRIRNAQQMGHESIVLPASKIKQRIAEVLSSEGFVGSVASETDGAKSTLTVGLKYSAGKVGVINEIRRVSRPGRRVYVSVDELPRVRNGLGRAILSTSRGVMTDRQAREQRVGGELLCTVW